MVPGLTWKFTRVCGCNPNAESADQESKSAATDPARDIRFLTFIYFGFRNAQEIRALRGDEVPR
jgi:hypothetical protein